MERTRAPYLPQVQRGIALTFARGAALFVLIALAGCSLLPTAQPVAATRPAMPAFVYPIEPPIVGVAELQSLLVRLDAKKTVLWVFDDTLQSASIARLLADARDELRFRNTALVALYAGSPDDWSPKVVPMLRAADANFICAVANPPQHPNLGLWLGQNPKRPANGLYVVAQDRRVLMRSTSDETAIRELVDSLRSPRPLATQASQAAPSWWARVRVIDLTTGSVLASAEAQAAEPVDLAELLAGRLLTTGVRPASLAVLPLRQAGSIKPGSQGEGMRLSDDLGRHLATAGWPELVPVATACEVLAGLGRSPLDAEFDPVTMAGQTRWKAVLVGTLRIESASGAP